MNVRLIHQTYLGAALGHVEEGKVVEVPDAVGFELIANNKAERTPESFATEGKPEDKKKGAR